MKLNFYCDDHNVDWIDNAEFAPRAGEEVALLDKHVYRVINIRWIYDVATKRDRYAFVALEKLA